MSACRSCHAAVLWVRMENGAAMVNATPSPDGTVEVFPVDGQPRRGRVRTGSIFDEPPAEGATLHVSHFATCPNASKHRRPR